MLLDDFTEIDKESQKNVWLWLFFWFCISQLVNGLIMGGGAFLAELIRFRGSLIKIHTENRFLEYWLEVVQVVILLAFSMGVSIALLYWRMFKSFFKDKVVYALLMSIAWTFCLGIGIFLFLVIAEGKMAESFWLTQRRSAQLFAPIVFPLAGGLYFAFFRKRWAWGWLTYLAAILIGTTFIAAYRYFDLLR